MCQHVSKHSHEWRNRLRGAKYKKAKAVYLASFVTLWSATVLSSVPPTPWPCKCIDPVYPSTLYTQPPLQIDERLSAVVRAFPTIRRRHVEIPAGLAEVPPLLARILAARGMSGAEELDLSLNRLPHPRQFGGLEQAVALLLQARREHWRVCVVCLLYTSPSPRD